MAGHRYEGSLFAPARPSAGDVCGGEGALVHAGVDERGCIRQKRERPIAVRVVGRGPSLRTL